MTHSDEEGPEKDPKKDPNKSSEPGISGSKASSSVPSSPNTKARTPSPPPTGAMALTDNFFEKNSSPKRPAPDNNERAGKKFKETITTKDYLFSQAGPAQKAAASLKLKNDMLVFRVHFLVNVILTNTFNIGNTTRDFCAVEICEDNEEEFALLCKCMYNMILRASSSLSFDNWKNLKCAYNKIFQENNDEVIVCGRWNQKAQYGNNPPTSFWEAIPGGQFARLSSSNVYEGAKVCVSVKGIKIYANPRSRQLQVTIEIDDEILVRDKGVPAETFDVSSIFKLE